MKASSFSLFFFSSELFFFSVRVSSVVRQRWPFSRSMNKLAPCRASNPLQLRCSARKHSVARFSPGEKREKRSGQRRKGTRFPSLEVALEMPASECFFQPSPLSARGGNPLLSALPLSSRFLSLQTLSLEIQSHSPDVLPHEYVCKVGARERRRRAVCVLKEKRARGKKKGGFADSVSTLSFLFPAESKCNHWALRPLSASLPSAVLSLLIAGARWRLCSRARSFEISVSGS